MDVYKIEIHIKYFQIDHSAAFHAAIKDVFKNSKILLCWAHVFR